MSFDVPQSPRKLVFVAWALATALAICGAIGAYIKQVELTEPTVQGYDK